MDEISSKVPGGNYLVIENKHIKKKQSILISNSYYCSIQVFLTTALTEFLKNNILNIYI